MAQTDWAGGTQHVLLLNGHIGKQTWSPPLDLIFNPADKKVIRGELLLRLPDSGNPCKYQVANDSLVTLENVPQRDMASLTDEEYNRLKDVKSCEARYDIFIEYQRLKDEHEQLKDEHEQLKDKHQQLKDKHEQVKELGDTTQDHILQLQGIYERECQARKQDELTFNQLKAKLEGKNQQLKEDNLQLHESYRQEQKSKLQYKAALQESIAFGIDPWKVNLEKVDFLIHEVDRGGSGEVIEGRLHVVIKRLYPIILSPVNVIGLMKEMQMLALLRHPNVLQFVAAVFDREVPYIITELLDTNLRSGYEKKMVVAEHYIRIFQDTARALDYLHQRYDPIIHLDVSSANVLLKCLPKRTWMANDVYSYGIVLCEVATCTFPEEDKFTPMRAQVELEWPDLCRLINSCIAVDPEKRPTMGNILDTLEKLPPQKLDTVI